MKTNLATAFRRVLLRHAFVIAAAVLSEDAACVPSTVAAIASSAPTAPSRRAVKGANAGVGKTGTADMSGGPVKARTKAPVAYPTPELDTFRATEREWIIRKAKSETMSRTYDNLIRQFNLNDSDRGYFWALMEKREDGPLSFMPTDSPIRSIVHVKLLASTTPSIHRKHWLSTLQ